MEDIKLTHPYWIRLIGWCFLPIMFLVSVWCLFLPVWYEKYELSLIASGLFLGGGCLYMSIHGLLTLPFMNAVITLSEGQLQVNRKDKVTTVQWGSISKVRHVASTQVLHLYNNEGKRFLSVTEQLKGYNLLVEFLYEKSGLKL